jgi:hypothetical protein
VQIEEAAEIVADEIAAEELRVELVVQVVVYSTSSPRILI